MKYEVRFREGRSERSVVVEAEGGDDAAYKGRIEKEKQGLLGYVCYVGPHTPEAADDAVAAAEDSRARANEAAQLEEIAAVQREMTPEDIMNDDPGETVIIAKPDPPKKKAPKKPKPESEAA